MTINTNVTSVCAKAILQDQGAERFRSHDIYVITISDVNKC